MKKRKQFEFLDKAISVHGNKYDYSLVDYKNCKEKIKIICPIHGIFEQTPDNHLSGRGCQKCSKNLKLDVKEFIKKAKEIHGEKYDYSLVKYKSSKEKVVIICPIHGIFQQEPESHLRGCDCKLCVIDSQKKKNFVFVNELIKIHGDKYDYSLVDYINSRTKVKIICKEHGIFEIRPAHILSGQNCNKCSCIISKAEIELKDFIKSINITIIENSKSIIPPNELDIFIPSHNIAIEFNGLYWHSELFKDKNYHLNKTIQCEKQNIRLIHIFEDEWLFKKDIVKSRLKHILGLTENKIYARKCEIKEISPEQAKNFMDENHLQGYTNSKIRIGLFYKDELVSVMLFNKPRLGIGQNYDGYELSRFASKLGFSVIGGANKLLNYFIIKFMPEKIVSYANKRWSDGNLYEKLGFKLTHTNKPNYWYIVDNMRKHRFNFRKERLKKEGFDTKNKTEHEIMLERGINRIYDCGTLSYEL